MSITLLAATFALLLGAGATAREEGLHYQGLLPDGTGRGRVQHRGMSYAVSVGDEIPGWGRVTAVTARALFARRSLSDDEKEARRAEGLFAPDVQELRIPAGPDSAAAPARR
jgi:hypothetical protein